MQLLDYLKLAADSAKQKHGSSDLRIAVITNFTDDLLKKILTGMCASEEISADIYCVPFKQYLFALKDPKSELAKFEADITFIFFDHTPYLHSEFMSDPAHANDVLRDIAAYAKQSKGDTVVHTLAVPSSRQHHRLLRSSSLRAIAEEFNKKLEALAGETANLFIVDTDALVRTLGETKVRDLRGLYAFSQPFSHEFILATASEWMSHVRARVGRVHKCIVLDLDGVLWGGIVGELGALGIALGQEYPGNAYREFQRTLLSLYEHGIILAINSRNNEADVEEVFEKNKNMILQKKHFAAAAINWESKADNLRLIARELNLGLDSVIFIDDDPANRELVRMQLPEVMVPEWSMPPEEYVHALINLDLFHSRALTEEDAKRGAMYAAERERRVLVEEVPNMEEYIRRLEITTEISLNDLALIPRLAQLTQKTNQYNLSTRRMSEGELLHIIEEGGSIYAGSVKDRFGEYGTTVIAIFRPKGPKEAELHTFLMSCRVMGRGVEETFFGNAVQDMRSRGYTSLTAVFIPSTKNAPIRDFLPRMGAKAAEVKESGEIVYELS